MIAPYDQLDRRFANYRSLVRERRPSRGWIRAIRQALGMTTAQLAKRMAVPQPRVIELERGEAEGKITVQSLERAAEALGCRFVYVLVPIQPLTKTINERAAQLADRQLESVEQTMRLEAQEVNNKTVRKNAYLRLVKELLRRPARLWDEQ
jgi:predicted DNA-binding mobile mystery protein A